MPAFLEVLDRLRPQLIIVWNQSIITTLERSNIVGLIPDMEDLGMQALTLTIFTYNFSDKRTIDALKSYLHSPYTINKDLLSLFAPNPQHDEQASTACAEALRRLRCHLNHLHNQGLIIDNTSLRFHTRTTLPFISNGQYTVRNYNNIHTGIVKYILDDIFSIPHLPKSITQTQFITHSLFVPTFTDWSSALKAYKCASETSQLVIQETAQYVRYERFIESIMSTSGNTTYINPLL